MSNTKDMASLVVFERDEALLVAKASEFGKLTIAGLDDRVGFERAHDARMELRGYRVEIEKTRVDLKADALEFGRKVDKEAKRLTALIEPTERVLEVEEKRITDERERIKAEEVAAKKRVLDDRMAALVAVGANLAPSAVVEMSDMQYSVTLSNARKVFEVREAERVETERLAAERRESERVEAERKAREESQRVAAERRTHDEKRAADELELAAERKRLADERALIDAEKVKIEAARPKPAPEPIPARHAVKHCPTCTCGGLP